MTRTVEVPLWLCVVVLVSMWAYMIDSHGWLGVVVILASFAVGCLLNVVRDKVRG